MGTSRWCRRRVGSLGWHLRVGSNRPSGSAARLCGRSAGGAGGASGPSAQPDGPSRLGGQPSGSAANLPLQPADCSDNAAGRPLRPAGPSRRLPSGVPGPASVDRSADRQPGTVVRKVCQAVGKVRSLERKVCRLERMVCRPTGRSAHLSGWPGVLSGRPATLTGRSAGLSGRLAGLRAPLAAPTGRWPAACELVCRRGAATAGGGGDARLSPSPGHRAPGLV
jgi:hypothetical protein